MMLKNSNNEKSASLTFAVIAMVIVSLSLLLGSISEITIGGLSAKFTPMDAGTIGTFLTPVLGLYFGRRWTDAFFNSKKKEKEDKNV